MKIIRAEHLGMCFGVRDAVALALDRAQQEPLTILGDLVHNETVLSELKARGVQTAQQPSAVTTATVMITAHGASALAIGRARARGLQVLEATCPLVHAAHRSLLKLVAEGYHPVVIGRRGHVEVRGLTEDLVECDIALTEAELFEIRERAKFGVIAQTTQPIERVRFLAGLLRWRFPDSEVRLVDTVCQPTKQRQNAALELAQQSDVVVVIGGNHSNNTAELVHTCRRHCSRVYHVQTAEDLQPGWFAGAHTVGITAGTSTPEPVILAVELWLQDEAARRSHPARAEASTRSLPTSHPLSQP